jgi:radical SAM protein with 4Fe4S-binding SPASM domain
MLIVAWETTAACNLKCGYCRACASVVPEEDELTTDEAQSFIDSITPLQPMLILSGGEPLLRPDIFQLARYAKAHGLRVSLATNGTLLTPQMANEIAASGIGRVSISLDGAKAEMHDENRGRGSFEAATKGLEYLKGKVDFQINFTITKRNESEILEVFRLAETAGAVALHFFFLVPTGRGKDDDLITPKRQEELLRMIDGQRAKTELEVQVTCAPQYTLVAAPERKGRRGGCLAGKNFIFVSRRGEVYPCGYLPVKAGSIREKDFIEIWKNSPVLESLRTHPLKGKCGNCSHNNICGGCRARAWALKGDFLDADPQCCLAV